MKGSLSLVIVLFLCCIAPMMVAGQDSTTAAAPTNPPATTPAATEATTPATTPAPDTTPPATTPAPDTTTLVMTTPTTGTPVTTPFIMVTNATSPAAQSSTPYQANTTSNMSDNNLWSVRDCSKPGERSLIEVTTLEIGPNPMMLPGEITRNIDFKVLEEIDDDDDDVFLTLTVDRAEGNLLGEFQGRPQYVFCSQEPCVWEDFCESLEDLEDEWDFCGVVWPQCPWTVMRTNYTKKSSWVCPTILQNGTYTMTFRLTQGEDEDERFIACQEFKGELVVLPNKPVLSEADD